MKKTCEGLGGNSDCMQHSKGDEVTSSSSDGTPNSMHSATGSIFSRSSDAKEKVSSSNPFGFNKPDRVVFLTPHNFTVTSI